MKDKIGILTYDVPHRKTQDLIMSLWFSGFNNITLLTTKFIDRPQHKSLLPHRPPPFRNWPNIVIEKQDIPGNYEYDFDFSQFKHILIGGAGIIPERVTKKWEIINSHPGWLPNVRGLDALKWALWEKQPIGITTYFIGAEADTGMLIDQKKTPILETDTFYSLASRHYSLELSMLVEAISKGFGKEYWSEDMYLGKEYESDCEFPNHSAVHKRMPSSKEIHLEALLQERIRNADPIY